MVQNNCLPANVYGGNFQQTLFLGCSIMSVSTSAGLNEQVSELTVQLAQDTCAGNTRIYYDSTLTQQSTTDADPGFIGEGLTEAIIGCPVYFRIADFEFSGMIQSWEKNNSESANPSYTVKLVDPRQILEGAQLIIGDYAGPVGNTNNLFNVFGALETLGATCPTYYATSSDPALYVPGDGSPDGAIFGSHAGYYGGADVNANGMQWNQILLGMNLLINAFGVIPSTLGGFGGPNLRFQGPTGVAANYGLMPNDLGNQILYYLDVSELPSAPSYYRINGTNISILEVINTITQDAGYDYYIELIPVRNSQLSPSGVAKFIKVRTINRAVTPQLGQIQTFIDNSNGFISSNVGRELRNETTNAFIIGGQKETLYQAEQNEEPGFFNSNCMEADTADDDMIVPFFGTDDNGNAVRPIKDVNGFWEFEVSTISIQNQLKQLAFTEQTVTINEKELRFALGGYDAWLSYSTSADTKTDIATAAFPPELLAVFNLDHLVTLLKDPDAKTKIQANDLLNTTQEALLFPELDDDVNNQKLEDLRTIFDWVNTFASEYYGKQFMVRIPFTCIRSDSENAQIITSEVPTDGGWTEQSTILRLPNNTSLVTFFTLEDNRVGAFVRFNDISDKESPNLTPDNYGIYDHNLDDTYDLYVRASVSEELVYYNKAIFCNPRVVISINDTVTTKDDKLNVAIKGLPELLAEILKAQNEPQAVIDTVLENVRVIMKGAGGKEIYFPIKSQVVLPDAACFGMKSNILTYGPWYNPGPPGKVLVEKDDGLVPWEYSGYTNLNIAGQYRADLAVNNMQVGEMGSITVAGYPTLPLGSEIGAIAGGYFGAGTNLIENRSASINQYIGGNDNPIFVQYGSFSYGGAWTGLYGPNVTSIQVTVGPEGLTTNYALRSFTPQFGRFSKANAERMRQIGQQRVKAVRALRLTQLRRRTNQFSVDKQINARDTIAQRIEGKHTQNTSPHSLLVGSVHQGFETGTWRTNLVTQEMSELSRDMSAETWPNLAAVSWDALFRPIRIGGNGTGLAELSPASYNPGNLKGVSRGAYPPVFKDSSSVSISITGAENNLEITSRYLNPFANPGDLKHVDPTGDCGHDINVIARGASPPATSISIPLTEGLTGNGYTADYRPIVFRGPLVIGGWGYTTKNKPVPNHTGYGGNTGQSDYFAPNWLQQPDTWPVGPVDLRWDEDRGMWVAPPQHNLVRIKLTQDISPLSTGIGVLVDMNGNNIGRINDATGAAITTPTVLVYDGLGIGGHNSGYVWGHWDAWEEKYLLVNSAIRVTNSGCSETGIPKFVRNEIVCGTGIKFVYMDDSGNVYDDLAPPDYSRIGLISNIKAGNWGGCLLNSTGDIYEVVSGIGDEQRFEHMYFAKGLIAVADTGQGSCNIVVGLDITITGNSPGTGGVATGQYLGNRLILDQGLTIDIDSSDFGDGTRCGLTPKIGLLHGDKTGSIPIVTGVYCSGSSLVVQTGELVWQYGQISGVRDYTP